VLSVLIVVEDADTRFFSKMTDNVDAVYRYFSVHNNATFSVSYVFSSLACRKFDARTTKKVLMFLECFIMCANYSETTCINPTARGQLNITFIKAVPKILTKRTNYERDPADIEVIFSDE
jgi:hypothetical protein